MLTAVIRAEECIGCSKCIPACPVDAIIGTSKFLHTVLLDECIGCKLCVDPCPVDCIDMLPLHDLLPADSIIDKHARAIKAKQRHRAQQIRLQRASQRQLPSFANEGERRNLIRSEIAAAVLRANNKANG